MKTQQRMAVPHCNWIHASALTVTLIIGDMEVLTVCSTIRCSLECLVEFLTIIF